MCKDNRKDSNL